MCSGVIEQVCSLHTHHCLTNTSRRWTCESKMDRFNALSGAIYTVACQTVAPHCYRGQGQDYTTGANTTILIRSAYAEATEATD